MHVPLDYDTLRVIWWALLGLLLIGFAVFDGFDLGTAILLPFLGRTDMERRILINAIGPVWEGNQVWFILGGGASFAAWPAVYAASFSGFYVAMFITLVALILRPVAFKFRGKIDNALWRSVWDWALFFGGLAPALIFGVAFGNLLLGVPFVFDEELRVIYTGSFFRLLNPFALLCGLVSAFMLIMHGAAYVQAKTVEPIARRARLAGMIASVVTLTLFALGGVYAHLVLAGYDVASVIAANAPSNPLRKSVEIATAGWMRNYERYPWTAVVPILGLAGCLLALVMFARRRETGAFLASAIAVAGIVATPGVAMFPFIMPECQPHGLGCLVQPFDAVHHARGRRNLPADGSGLYGLGLPPVARQGSIAHLRARRARLLRGRMWYFSWVLGLGLACAFAILNAMWLELDQ